MPGIPFRWPRSSPTPRPTCTARSSSSARAVASRQQPRFCSETTIASMKVEAREVEGRKVYSVRAFNQGVAVWLQRLPTLWVEGEITELRRQVRWQSVFFTLKDPDDGACL